ncbi:hypothetical protein ANAPH2_01259 [Anaplasma phagocytophilum]|nr:hypothetical protein ANAPH2_01259 [Anaplasma phagocytophilum]
MHMGRYSSYNAVTTHHAHKLGICTWQHESFKFSTKTAQITANLRKMSNNESAKNAHELMQNFDLLLNIAYLEC